MKDVPGGDMVVQIPHFSLRAEHAQTCRLSFTSTIRSFLSLL